MQDRRLDGRSLSALLIAKTISALGSPITAVALPWFVLVTTGSPAKMSFVLAAEFLGIIIFGIPGGNAASRVGARRAMLATDLPRTPLVALVPVLSWARLLSFPALMRLVFCVGAFFSAYQSSQQVGTAPT